MNKKYLIPAVSIAVIFFGVLSLLLKDNSVPATSQMIKIALESKNTKKCYIQEGNLFVQDGQKLYKISTEAYDVKDAAKNCEVVTKSPFPIDFIALVITILVLLATFYRYSKIVLNPRQESQSVQKQQNEYILPMSSDCTFDDIAGVEEAKEELFELVDYLRNPSKYSKMGIRMPRGVLLVGPPGVGKTLLAKALANSAGVPFYYKSAATFVEMYVGVGAKRVSDLFAAANKNAPAIIFIDEIDAIGRKRSGDRNEEREATLNQLLTEMDGFSSGSGVLAIAATNKPDVLDEALMRANRFDRKVYVDLPDLSGRRELFELYLRGKMHRSNIDELARSSVGFSGAMISSYVNEAALNALKYKKEAIDDNDFSLVASKVIDGKKRALALDESQRVLLASGQAAKFVLSQKLNIRVEHISLNECRITAQNEEFMSEADFMALITFYMSSSVYLNKKFGHKYAIFWQDERRASHFAELSKMKYLLFDTLDYSQIILLAKENASGLLDQYCDELNYFASKLLLEQKL